VAELGFGLSVGADHRPPYRRSGRGGRRRWVTVQQGGRWQRGGWWVGSEGWVICGWEGADDWRRKRRRGATRPEEEDTVAGGDRARGQGGAEEEAIVGGGHAMPLAQ
jgi:hypothetical protein